jgi:hypothetical protein
MTRLSPDASAALSILIVILFMLAPVAWHVANR